MSAIQLPADLSDRYELLADRLDGFDDARELVQYVLESTAAEVERGGATGADGVDSPDDADRADDDVVADRLEQLGYLEK
jgi:hypothetical protein